MNLLYKHIAKTQCKKIIIDNMVIIQFIEVEEDYEDPMEKEFYSLMLLHEKRLLKRTTVEAFLDYGMTFFDNIIFGAS